MSKQYDMNVRQVLAQLAGVEVCYMNSEQIDIIKSFAKMIFVSRAMKDRAKAELDKFWDKYNGSNT